MQKKDKGVVRNKIKIYLYFVRRFRRRFIIFLGFSLGLSLTQTVLLAALYPFVSLSMNQGPFRMGAGLVLEYIYGAVQKMPAADPLACAGIVLIILAVFLAAFRYYSLSSALNLTYAVNYALQEEMYGRVMRSDMEYFIDNRQGDIVFRIKDPPAKTGLIIKSSAVLIQELLLTSFLLLMMLTVHIKITMLIFVIGSAFGMAVRYIARRIVYKSGMAETGALGGQDIILAESLGGINTIKAYLGEKRWVKTFTDKVSEYIRYARRTEIAKQFPLLALEAFVIIVIALSAVVFKGLYPVSFAEVLPVFSVYALSILRIIPSLSRVGNSGMNIAGLFANMELCYEMLHRPASKIKDGPRTLEKFQRAIDFIDVTFAYPGSGRPVFEGLSVGFKKNRITAIAGKTGSGKTTLINLLLRFYDPAQGRIEVDGIDLKQINRVSWISKVGYVAQEPFIFHDTIAQNIAFGRACLEHEIQRAARLAGAHQFIANLKYGYNTIVGEKGMRLSGGERQRIAVARAMLRNPQLLIFDEATSAVDAVTEAFIQEAVREIASSCTVIIIAHRLSTVKAADKILVFDGGKVLEEGRHEDLLRANNHYSKLYMTALEAAE